jgi:hypothetical protein
MPIAMTRTPGLRLVTQTLLLGAAGCHLGRPARQLAPVVCAAPSPFSAEFAPPLVPDDVHGLRAMEMIRDSIVGTYRWIEVTTEGSGRSRWMAESRVVFTARVPIDTSRRMGQWTNVIADGSASLIRAGDPATNLIAPREPVTFRLLATFSAGHLSFRHFDARFADVIVTDDPRPMYDVVDIDSAGTIAGRWVGGGIAGVVVDTPLGPIGEMPAGYFCAIKERPRPSSTGRTTGAR